MSQNSTLRDESGRPLEVKEGVVIDRTGEPLGETWHRAKQTKSRVFVWKGGGAAGILLPIFLIPIVLILVAFGGFMAVFAAISVGIWLLRSLISAFRGRG